MATATTLNGTDANTATKSASKRRTKAKPEVTSGDVEARLSQLRADFAALTETVSAYGKAEAGALKKRGEAYSDELVAQSKDALATFADELSRLERDVASQVREKPVQAIGIAAAVGFLAAMILRR